MSDKEDEPEFEPLDVEKLIQEHEVPELDFDNYIPEDFGLDYWTEDDDEPKNPDTGIADYD